MLQVNPLHVSPDAILESAWTYLAIAKKYNARLNEQTGRSIDAAFAEVDKHIPRNDGIVDRSEEERVARGQMRDDIFMEIWRSRPELQQPFDDQERLWNEVIDPLHLLIYNTVPETLRGAAIKARALLDSTSTAVRNPDEDDALIAFIEQIAELSDLDHRLALASEH